MRVRDNVHILMVGSFIDLYNRVTLTVRSPDLKLLCLGQRRDLEMQPDAA